LIGSGRSFPSVWSVWRDTGVVAGGEISLDQKNTDKNKCCLQ
jgi:hypothetical protein